MRVGYPSPDAEWEMLERRLGREEDEPELTPVVARDELISMQRAVERVYVSESVGRYIVALVAATRESPSVQVGASPRGTLALLKLTRVKAVLDGRDFVVPDDIKAVAGAGVGTPAAAATRALGAASRRRRRGQGVSREGTSTADRGRRLVTVRGRKPAPSGCERSGAPR
jgi:MoxR-like ATPase